MSLPVAVEFAARKLEQVPPLAKQQWATLAQQADAIVVLGNGRERNSPTWGQTRPPVLDSSACVWRLDWRKNPDCRY